ncbi:single-stranded DNA-binding protein [Mesoaciditoga sp.]
MNYNKVILVGRITHEPEMRISQNGTEVVNFQLAVNRYGKDKQADFFRIVCFGKSAEFVSTYVKKGTLLLVDGSLRNNVWEDSTGQKRSNTEIVASRVEIMEKRGSTFNVDDVDVSNEESFSDDNLEDNNAEDINEGEGFEGDDSDEIPF